MGRRSYLSTDLARPFRGDCPAITGRMTCSSDVGHRCWAVIDIVLGGYDSLRRRSSRLIGPVVVRFKNLTARARQVRAGAER